VPSAGTSAGLVDEKQAQSVFKHEVLRQYIPRFIVKTTMGVNPRRCVLFDGFAGTGRYLDGSAGSGEYLMIEAQKQKANVQTTVFVVEQKASNFTRLQAVAEEWINKGLDIRAVRGECLDVLPNAVTAAAGASLFLFIDPCGAAIPWQTFVDTLNARRGWPPTEVLLNFSADLTRRAAGVVRAGDVDHPAVHKLNSVCGGTWWQQLALDTYIASGQKNWEEAANAVSREYARRVGLATSRCSANVPVRRREHHQPIYHLIYLTPKPHGLWVMGDAIAKARRTWLEFLGPGEEELSEMLFDTVEGQLEREQTDAQGEIEAHILAAVQTHRRFKISDQPVDVFGATWGVALEKTAGVAARSLEKAGSIQITRGKNGTADYVISAPSS